MCKLRAKRNHPQNKFSKEIKNFPFCLLITFLVKMKPQKKRFVFLQELGWVSGRHSLFFWNLSLSGCLVFSDSSICWAFPPGPASQISLCLSFCGVASQILLPLAPTTPTTTNHVALSFTFSFCPPSRCWFSLSSSLWAMFVLRYGSLCSKLWMVAFADFCEEDLGLESGELGDEALTASSSYDPANVGPKNARCCAQNPIENPMRNEAAWPKYLR